MHLPRLRLRTLLIAVAVVSLAVVAFGVRFTTCYTLAAQYSSLGDGPEPRAVLDYYERMEWACYQAAYLPWFPIPPEPPSPAARGQQTIAGPRPLEAD